MFFGPGRFSGQDLLGPLPDPFGVLAGSVGMGVLTHRRAGLIDLLLASATSYRLGVGVLHRGVETSLAFEGQNRRDQFSDAPVTPLKSSFEVIHTLSAACESGYVTLRRHASDAAESRSAF